VIVIIGKEERVAEIRIEERKRGAPWSLILLLVIVAAVIGWWLWSHRADSTATPANTPSGAVTDSTGTTRTP
jgi:lipopolysaccharide export system protein LptC